MQIKRLYTKQLAVKYGLYGDINTQFKDTYKVFHINYFQKAI